MAISIAGHLGAQRKFCVKSGPKPANQHRRNVPHRDRAHPRNRRRGLELSEAVSQSGNVPLGHYPKSLWPGKDYVTIELLSLR